MEHDLPQLPASLLVKKGVMGLQVPEISPKCWVTSRWGGCAAVSLDAQDRNAQCTIAQGIGKYHKERPRLLNLDYEEKPGMRLIDTLAPRDIKALNLIPKLSYHIWQHFHS